MSRPRLFGVVEATTTVTGETCHVFRFGALEVGMAYIKPRDGSDPVGVPWWVGKQRGTAHFSDGWARTVDGAIAAIEGELRGIHGALSEVIR